jgi:F-type H+-transporting ATPase subunit delta
MSRDRTLGHQLGAAGDEVTATMELAEDVFAIAQVLREQPVLQRRLTEPTIPAKGRAELAEAVFGSKVSRPALGILQSAAKLPFSNGGDFTEAIHDEGVRTVWRAADTKGEFVSARSSVATLADAVASNGELNAVLDDETYSLSSRQNLVSGLLGKKAGVYATLLAVEAVSHNERTCAHELVHYLEVGERLRARLTATVSTAIETTKAQSAKLVSELTRIYGVPVDAVFKVDTSVVGGVRIEVADEVIDGSVITKLRDVESKLG